MTADLKIVHESEVQRQHVRVEIPAGVRIGGRTYKIKNLSAGGFALHETGRIREERDGRVEFVFPFPGYALQCVCKASQLGGWDKGAARFRFTGLGGAQMALISHIVRARMAGTLVDGGELLNIAGRGGFAELKSRLPQERIGWRQAFWRVAPAALFSAAGLAGLLFMLGNAYERSAIFKSYQAVVEAGTIAVRAQEEGEVRLLLSDVAEKVAKGQPLAVIERRGKEGPVIASPCDCSIRQRLVQDGEFRAFGETLFTLVPSDAAPWITALVPPEKAHHFRLQDDVRVRIAGEGGFVAGHIADIGSGEGGARIRIRPEKKMSTDLLGRPAYVEFALYE